MPFRHPPHPSPHVDMNLLCLLLFVKTATSDITQNDMEFLNELPIEKLLTLKNSLQVLVKDSYENVTENPQVVETFGAQALALKSPVKREDHEEGWLKKGEHGKMSNVFSLAVTALAFLAFGGYLLCLIVQAVKSKNNMNQVNVPQTTMQAVFLSGIKRPPQSQFASYGRRKRENSEVAIDLPPDQMFSALLGLCEGYAKWSERNSD